MPKLEALFGQSPVHAIKAHSEKVHACVGLIGELFEAAARGDGARAAELCEQVILAETEADKVQNDAHERLVSRLLLPVGKADLVNILDQQDSIADRAEDLAAVLTYREMTIPEELRADLRTFVERVLQNCELTAGIVSKIDLLIESSFGGRDALTVSRLVSERNDREDETKSVQIGVTRRLLVAEHGLGPLEAMLWKEAIDLLGEMSRYADHTASAIRRVLEVR